METALFNQHRSWQTIDELGKGRGRKIMYETWYSTSGKSEILCEKLRDDRLASQRWQTYNW